jgi:prepilin-type N-terminal cleavage/methylation domain-containing protein/prepilin-type processing-associated H-X9-DG protein
MNQPSLSRHPVSQPTRRAFTLIELLVVIASIALVLSCVAPSLARSKTGGQVFQCVNNHRQLANAWQMYAIENHGKLPMNPTSTTGSNPTGKPWAWGRMSWELETDNTNTLFLTDERYCAIAKYLGRNPRVFKCPADTVVSLPQQTRGWKERVRSYSMNAALGAGNAPGLLWGPIYHQVIKLSDLRIPTMAETYVFAEEHPDSLNDTIFLNPLATEWPDVPASYHNGAAVFSFADAHVEIHKWSGSLATNSLRIVRAPSFLNRMPKPAGDPDSRWVSYRIPRISEATY